MKVAVALETRFVRTPDGSVWSQGAIDRGFWQRYLNVFDEVKVIARIAQVREAPPEAKRADGDRISFAPIPYYLGPWQYAARYRSLRKAVAKSLALDDAVVLRVPGAIGTLVERALSRWEKPFGVEVVGDPWDSLAGGAVRSFARSPARFLARRALRRQCRSASAVSYVTRCALQRRYPPAPGVFTTHYSSIDLGGEAFVSTPRSRFPDAHRLVFVGTLAVLYKCPDVLLRAVARCRRRDVQLTMVGGGRCRHELETLADSLGIASRVRFTGNLASADQVRSVLDRADLFVLPSRQEGLPRSLIEAMARALPCVASTVGGIPELLPAEDLVSPGDVDGLAARIADFLDDEERLRRTAQRNLQTAQAYHRDVLSGRRDAFYLELRRISAAGLIHHPEK